MKRSKIFLGLTTGLLAVAAIAATKAHRLDRTLPGYYSIASGGGCVQAGGTYFTVLSKSSTSNIATVNTKKIYTVRHTTPCSGKVLYTAPLD